MGAFIIAAFILTGALALAFLVAFAQGMATAPQYDNTPQAIAIGGAVIATLVASSHWWPHIGW